MDEAERFRRESALLAKMADDQAALAAEIRDVLAKNPGDPSVSSLPFDPERIARLADVASYRTRTMQRLVAERARAYDDYVAAGGSSNPEAHAEWLAACEYLDALIPRPGDGIGT